MSARVMAAYLFGGRDAIRQLSTQRTWPVGIWLVLLTSIARNYDQTHISESPVLWVLGSLLFSFFSGTFIFAGLLYLFLKRRTAATESGPGFGVQWISFIGLFWLTAPIAWLYAIPVERFADSLTATKLNLALLSLVALWRVVLLSRVVQVVTEVRFWTALIWVLVPASAEAVVVFFAGSGFSRALMASMGGLRNSPEEELIGRVLGDLSGASLAAFALAFSLGLVLLRFTLRNLKPFPTATAARVPWVFLITASVFWAALAVPNQRQLWRSVQAERLLRTAEPRAFLDYLAARQRAEFAPARPLPPKAFEYDVFRQLPPLLGATSRNDPPWVHEYLLHRLTQMCSHFQPRTWEIRAEDAEESARETTAGWMRRWLPEEPRPWVQVLDGLEQIPSGRAWAATNQVIIQGLAQFLDDMAPRPSPKEPADEPETTWEELRERLRRFTD